MTPGRRAWWGRLGGVDDVVVERVLRAVEQVPPGRVVSYGDVAALVGIGPRQVGSIMKAYGGNVTWWRVTDAAGDLPATLMDEARERWAAEGILLKPGGRAVFAEPNLLNPQVMAMFNVGALKEKFAVSPDERAFTRFKAARTLRRIGFTEVSVRPFDFLHPSVPPSWVDAAARFGRGLERVPLVREIAGSLLICADKPGRRE